MKKLIAISLMSVMIFVLVACGSQEANPEQQATESIVETTSPRDLPEGDYAEKGEGVVYILTPGGTSEDGNIPVLYVAADTLMTQVGLEAWGFNGSTLSYVYIDGMLIAKEQLADTQISLTLKGSQIAGGIHKVEVVQYGNDDPLGEMITYRTMEYEVKSK